MNDDQARFLNLIGQPSARVTAEQAAWILNCQPHDIPVLVGSRLLRPLGNPPVNGTKFFSTAEILELSRDRSWLAKVTNTICQHWKKKNALKKSPAYQMEQSYDAENPDVVAGGARPNLREGGRR